MPAAPLIAVAAGACAACGTALAPDQRYCVECGQRQAAPRLPAFAAAPTPATATTTLVPADGGRALSGRLPPATTAIAVIGSLLLAMAIGVFIGQSGNGGSSKTATQVVSVISPPSAAGTAAAAAPTTPTTTTPAVATSTAKKTATTAKSTPSVPKKPTPPIVKVGSKGTGPGYQNGKFTGNFFGN